MFIDKYFNKQGFWKLPPLLELVSPTLFNKDYDANKSS
jgi:hypothetical protein